MATNYLNNGDVKYKFKRILFTKNLHEKYLFCHNDILTLLKTWNGSINQNKKHLLLRSNYPWLFSSRNEIKINEDLQQHRILPIIAFSEIGRKSLTALKNVVLHDKYAHVIELLTVTGLFRKWSKTLSKIKTPAKPYPCLVHGVNIMMKKKIMYYGGGGGANIPSFIDFQDIITSMYNNDDIRIYTYYLQILAHYNLTHNDMEKRLCHIDSVQFIRSICEIILGNNRKIISYLQGKESAVRTAVPKRVPSCRAQISLAPQLQATQIGLPYWWAKYCNFESSTQELVLYDTAALYDEIPTKFLYRLHGQRIIAKRDPIIHILAFCIFDQVFFHRDSRCFVGAESLKKTASDFDGDTWILYFTDDLRVMHEIDYNASPRYSMALHGQCRINLIESIVLAMYKRNITMKIPHWQLYNFIRCRAIYKWLVNVRNCTTLEMIAKMNTQTFTLDRLYNMVEPTDTILATMLSVLQAIYGSPVSYQWYCTILRLTQQLSTLYHDAVLYQPDLPCDYTLTDDLLNFNLMAASLSCAKGNIHTYKSMLDKVYEKDKCTLLATPKSSSPNELVDDFDYDKLIADITNANMFAAKKSKQVPQQGYNLFKDTIEGDLMSFGANRLNYDNQVLIKDIHLYIPMQYIIDSAVAYTILYN